MSKIGGGHKEPQVTHKNQCSVEVIILLDIVCVMLGCFPLVHCIEIKMRIIILDRWEEFSKGILETTIIQ